MDELERRRLESEHWPESCIENYGHFGTRTSLLYGLIRKQGLVMTPKGQGTVIDVKAGEAWVQLVRGRGEKSRLRLPVEDVLPTESARRIA